MDKLKIFCKDSKDAKNKLNILERYGIDKRSYSGDISNSAYYILDTENKEINGCCPAANGIEDIPEVYYDFFNISDEARAKAYSNCSKYAPNPIIRLLSSGINYWFVWEHTPEGQDYWNDWYRILLKMSNPQTEENKKISIPTFEERYIAVAETNELIKEYLNNSLISKELHYENQLQRKEVNLSGRDGAKPVRVCNRRNKARIASKHPSYQKAIGRG